MLPKSSLLALFSAIVAAAPADNTIEIVGESGVSAQQLFLGTSNKVYIVDKTERNPVTVAGHPAWATEYDIDTNTYRAMDIVSNSFCAGGNVLSNGTWVNVGGNQAVTYGGLTGTDDTSPYYNTDGGKAVRTLDTCSDQSCDWTDDTSAYMTTRRWYPTLETLEDGRIIIIGGCDWGGYVNSADQNNPTYEFFPRASGAGPIGLNILTTTLPANLFPLTWLLPSGNIFIQTNWGTEIFDYKNNVEYPLSDIPYAVRTYPASGATAMLPLTPANNYTATILFCGGSNLQPDQWTTNWNIAAYPADDSCVSMTPDVSTDWVTEQSLPEARVMGNFIFLPDGRLVLINGIGLGTAGYGNSSWAIGQSYGDLPVHSIYYYDHSKENGTRFSDLITNSTVDRMYHSSATLLHDGSVFSSGSNPNADYVANGTAGYKYFTEYRVERFYPDYYTASRPAPSINVTSLGYGGDYFDIELSMSDLADDADNLPYAMVTLVRPGFSTHAMNMGQRFLQLNSSYEATSTGGTLHVSQVPPNPAIFVPGPALLYVVVNGVPSNGTWVTIGNGKLGDQTVSTAQELPGDLTKAGVGALALKSSANSTTTTSSSSTSESSAASTGSSSSTLASSAPLLAPSFLLGAAALVFSLLL